MTYKTINTKKYRTGNGKFFESQCDAFRCGPVSIINAIRYTKPHYVIGPATRRSICVTCDSRLVHDDGFEGTKPEKITDAITKIWPKYIYKTGYVDSCNLIADPSYKSFIILFAVEIIADNIHTKAVKKRPSNVDPLNKYYHYVFMYRKNNTFYIQNDNENKETRYETNDMINTYMNSTIYPRFKYQLPQVWALE